MADIIQLRGGTAAAWTSANPTLASKEIGVETDTHKLKIGNGLTPWNSLGYLATHIVSAAINGSNELLLEISDGTVLNAGQVPLPSALIDNYVTVGKSNAEFTSVKAAIEAITDNDATKPYVVKVYPGVYDEDPFAMKPYVSVVGQGSLYGTVLRTTDENNHFILGSHACELRGLSLDGPIGTGYAAARFENVLSANAALPFIMWDVAIRKGYYGVCAFSDGLNGHGRTKIHCINVVNYYTGTTIDTMFHSYGKSNITCFSAMVMSGPSTAVTTAFKAESTATMAAELTLDSCSMKACVTGLQTLGQTGKLATARLASCSFTGGTNGMLIGYGDVTAFGCTVSEVITTKHIDVDAYSSVLFGGTADKNKIFVAPGGSLSASFADRTTGEEGQVVIGELWLGGSLATSIPVKQYGLATYSTGWETGGAVEVNETALGLDIEAGAGYINNGTSVRRIAWNTTTVTATDNTEQQYVYVTDTDTVVISAVEPSLSTVIMLATIDAKDNDVTFLADHRVPIHQIIPSISNYLEEVIGPIATVGGIVLAHDISNTTQLTVEPGRYHLALRELTFDGADPAEIHVCYRNNGGWYHDKALYASTAWFPKYDDGSGALVATTTGKFVRHLLFVNVSNAVEYYHLTVGQTLFDSKALAEVGVNPNAATAQLKYSMKLAAIIMDDMGKIVSIVDQRPRLGQSATATITDHNQMSGKQGGAVGEFYHLTAVQVNKLDALPADAAANINADWDADSGDAFIENKPVLALSATGIISRGVISVNGSDNTKIDISAGTSLYVDNSDMASPVREILSWADTTAITVPSLTTNGRLWIGVQRTGPGTATFVFSAEFTHTEKRTIAIIGRVWSNGSDVIEGIGQYATPAFGYEKTLEDLMRALGTINIKGNIFTPHAGGLTLDKTTGQSFRFSANSGGDIVAPNVLTDAAQVNISAYHYHLGKSGSGFTTLLTTIDPNYYDLAGVKTAVPAGKYTVQRIYYFPKSGVVDVVYGQALYDLLVDAKAAINTEAITLTDQNELTLYGAVLRGWVAVKQGTTDLTTAADAVVIVANNTNSSAAVSGGVQTFAHDALLGLDHDDHTQYHTDTRGDLRYVRLTAVMTNTVGGLVPTPPNNTTTFLRGDGSFATPAPAGSTKQIQFNDGGAYAGDANLTWDKLLHQLILTAGSLGNTAIANPTPVAATLLQYVGDFGGRLLPKCVGPSGMDFPLQPHIGFQRVVQVIATGTTVAIYGTAAYTLTGGTIAYAAPTTGSIANQCAKISLPTGTTAGTVVYYRPPTGDATCYLGNVAGSGGFTFMARFGMSALANGNRIFIGLHPRGTVPTNQDPANEVNVVGLQVTANSGNWNITCNDGSGTATVTALASPAIALNSTDLIELVLFAAPNSATITYRVTNWSTGNQISGTLAANTPAVNTQLVPFAWLTNNASAAACTMWINRIYLETDH